MLALAETPRIYVACLATYNHGYLHGEWIDCDQDSEDIYAEIQEILKSSPVANIECCEINFRVAEWAIHDYENFHGIKIDEYESIEKLAELGQAIEEHGAAISFYYSHFGKLEDFEDYYQGCYKSEQDFVESQLEESGLTKAIEKAGLKAYYINFESMAEDWFISDYVSLKEDYDKYHIFSNH